MSQEVFRRVETKYILSIDEYNLLLDKLKNHLKKDKYFKSTICNIYFDTNNFDLIVNSIEKPMYKEKVRLRSYFVPTKDDEVFLEIKKKFNSIVGKRRIKIKLSDFYEYLESGNLKCDNEQIKEEIDYCFKKYHLIPKMYIAYDRLSYYDADDKNFRITFDTHIRSRESDLKLELGDCGKLLNDQQIIMETKSLNAYPLWFSEILSSLHIYPSSFSKYGSIYKKIKKEGNVYV